MRHTQGLRRAANQEGGRVATAFRGRHRTYSEVLERVARFAAALRAMGARPGDRIAIISANSDRYYEAYYAILWAGCIAVPGNTRWAPAEHAYALKDSAPSLILVDRAFAALGGQLASEFALPVVLIDDAEPGEAMTTQDGLIAATAPMADHGGEPSDLVGIFYTGGTTGWPKGVMLTHFSMIANFQSSTLVRPYPNPCVFLHSPPMFHLADATVIFGLTPLAATHVIVPGFDPAGVIATIQQEKVNALVLVPTMLNMMDLHLREHPADLSGVESVTYGASAISEARRNVSSRTSALGGGRDASGVEGSGRNGLSTGVPPLSMIASTPSRVCSIGSRPTMSMDLARPAPIIEAARSMKSRYASRPCRCFCGISTRATSSENNSILMENSRTPSLWSSSMSSRPGTGTIMMSISIVENVDNMAA